MPGFEVLSYRVNHLAFATGTTPRERRIGLQGRPFTPHPIDEATLVFRPGQPTELATIVGEPYNYITGRYALADFEDAYRLLQGERPLYFSWGFRSGTTQVIQLLLATSTEPIGEGPAELGSPLMNTLADE